MALAWALFSKAELVLAQLFEELALAPFSEAELAWDLSSEAQLALPPSF